jgi:proteasome accessory factor A
MATRLPKKAVLGLETEYALGSPKGRSLGDQRHLIADQLLAAMRRYPFLPDRDKRGLHLGNGALVYLDTGYHVEWATPELTNPFDAVVWDKAGERMLEEAAAACRKEDGVTFYKNNLDYAGHTWGCHESYLVSKRLSLERIVTELVPFWVTRQIYAGAGRISAAPEAMGFELSQRAAFITAAVSRETTYNRAIINTRDESLCGTRYRRLHLILGDALMSELGTFLKVGTTALLLRLMDMGISVGGGLAFEEPVRTMRRVSCDAFGKARLPLAGGNFATAVEVQREYLRNAEEHLGEKGLPSWAEIIVAHWGRVLDQLEQDPLALSSCLDAYIKLELYSRVLKRLGSSWKDLKREAHPDAVEDKHPLIVLLEVLTQDSAGNLDEAMARIATHPPEAKSTGVAQHLMALDIRYHDVSRATGLFYELERQGLVQHRVVSDEAIALAMTSPPSDTRAAVRGRVIRQFSGRSAAAATWDAILVDGRVLDLTDPFEDDEKWRTREEDD